MIFSISRDILNDTFRIGMDPISKSTMEKTVRRFEATGSVKDRAKLGRPKSATNEEEAFNVLLSLTKNPHSSLRRTTQAQEIGTSSVRRILKTNKLHPYKMTLVHEINEDDPDRCLEFCEDMMLRIDQDPDFLYYIGFSDEETFQINGTCNRHNCRYWVDENPHWMRESKTQYPQKLKVWVGIINNHLIGPFFIDGNLTAQRYENILRNEIILAIREIAGDNLEHVWFQQDGAAPHYGRNVRNYLDEHFPDRWIGRRGPIEWPARSPDLTLLVFFLWGYLEYQVYETKLQNLDELRQRIIDVSAQIPAEYLNNSIESI